MPSRFFPFNALLRSFLLIQAVTISWTAPKTYTVSTTNDDLIKLPILDQKEVDRFIRKVKIYVYEPPKPLNISLDLQKKCRDVYFYIEVELLRLIRQKTGKIAIIVDDPTTADFFWIPHTLQAHYTSWQGSWNYLRDALRPFLNYIVYDRPYYNMSGGSNHIFLYVLDNGPACDVGQPLLLNMTDVWSILRPMIFVGYFGMHGFTPIQPNGNHIRPSCFQIGHDITLPQYNVFHKTTSLPKRESPIQLLMHKASVALANLYFKGSFSEGFYCSKGIRLRLEHYLKKCMFINPAGNALNRSLTKITCNEVRTFSTHKIGLFWLCPAGWGCWSLRMYDAIHRRGLPVILSDGMIQPFERWFDYRAFTVKIITNASANRFDTQFPMLDRLHQDAVSFRQACSPCKGHLNETACLQHPVSRKLLSLEAHRPWFSWDADAPQNALKLFMLELYCRTRTGRTTALCRHSAPQTAHLEFGI